jgi:hypothetical protein
MKIGKTWCLALPFAGFLVGCATPLDPAILETSEYHEGYSHGCSTATKQSNGFQSEVVEDKSLMGTNEAYTAGWRQGFFGCGGQSIGPREYNQGEWYHDIGD